jgi:hypothetical protein
MNRGYRMLLALPQSSAMFAAREAAEGRIWVVRPKISCLGKTLVAEYRLNV